MNALAFLYQRQGSPIEVKTVNQWSLVGWIETLKLLFWLQPTNQSITIHARLLPLNRFRVIEQMNEWLTSWLMSYYFSHSQHYIIWINEPEWYWLHNKANYTHLVLGCSAAAIADENRYVRYRDFFALGWIFTYTFSPVPATTVFKSRTRSQIVKQLRTFNN